MFVHAILLQFADVISWFRLCHDGGKSEEFSKAQKCRLKELGLSLNNYLTMKVKVIKSAWNSKVVFCIYTKCVLSICFFLSIKCQHLIILVQFNQAGYLRRTCCNFQTGRSIKSC